MKQFNPPHPGEFLATTYMAELNITIKGLATSISEPVSVIENLVKGKISITDDLAEKLSAHFGNSKQQWLKMQAHFDTQ